MQGRQLHIVYQFSCLYCTCAGRYMNINEDPRFQPSLNFPDSSLSLFKSQKRLKSEDKSIDRLCNMPMDFTHSCQAADIDVLLGLGLKDDETMKDMTHGFLALYLYYKFYLIYMVPPKSLRFLSLFSGQGVPYKYIYIHPQALYIF